MPLPTRERESRRHGRLNSENLHCSMGEVINLSASGMQVLVRRRLLVGFRLVVVAANQDDEAVSHRQRRQLEVEQVLEVQLKYDQMLVRVRARVSWVRKCGFLRYLAGLEFIEVCESTSEGLRTLARLTSTCVTVPIDSG